MNVRKVVKTIAALGVGATMLGATLAGAMAADLSQFPKPMFINEDGAFNGLFVVGANAKTIDTIGMNAIATAVQAQAYKLVPVTSTSTSVVEVEDGVDLKSGSKELYLQDTLQTRKTTITSTDLSLLEDDTFDKDDGTSVTYEQTILVGNGTFKFAKDTSADIDDPALLVQTDRNAGSTGEWYYAYKVHFDEAINLNDDTNITGQPITLFGKSWTISSKSSNSNGLVLMGGSTDTTLQVGETKEVAFGGSTYTVELLGVASSTVASIKVNGNFKEVTEGNTYSIAGVDIYVDTVAEFSGTENAGLVTLQLGADELYLKNGQKVKVGSNKDSLDGTYVSATAAVGSFQEFIVYVSGETNQDKYKQPGETKNDAVFNAVQLDFTSVNYGLDSDDRSEIFIDKNGATDLSVTFEDDGNSAEIEFVHGATSLLQDSAGKDIFLYENAKVYEEEYFFLNQGDYQHYMQITSIDYDTGTPGDSELEFEDVFTGTSYTISSWASASATDLNATKVIDGTTYYVSVTYNSGTPYVQFTDSAYQSPGTNIQMYQYLEPVTGANFKIGFFDDVTYDPGTSTMDNYFTSAVTFTTPTGTFTLQNGTSNSTSGTTAVYDMKDDDVEFNVTVGNMVYEVTVDVSADLTFVPVLGTTELSTPAVFLVEDDDEANENHVVVLQTSYDGSAYLEASTPLMSHSKTYTVTESDSDFVGYIDYFGTYARTDNSDTNQKTSKLWYPPAQLYGKFFISPTGSGTTTTTSSTYSKEPVQIPSSANVFDTEVTSPMSQNMIVVGGPCVNSVAAKLMGNPANCAEGFVQGKAIIKLFDETAGMDAGKVAMLVAGYSGEDTRLASNVLSDWSAHADKLVGSEVWVSGTSSSTALFEQPAETTTTTVATTTTVTQ